MKIKGLKLLITATLFSASSAMASIKCENGTFEQKGDGYFALELDAVGIHFQPYEGSYSVPGSSVFVAPSTLGVVDYVVEKSAEGETWKSSIDAFLTYEPGSLAKKSFQANLAISSDNQPFVTFVLTCSQE